MTSPWAIRTLLFGVAVLALGRIRGEVVGANDASRYATMIAIVEQGTTDLRGVRLAERTMDKVRIGERLVSSKPPVLSTLGAAIYAVLHHGFGLRFDRDAPVVVFVIVALLGTVPLVLLLWLFHGLLRAEAVGAGAALGSTALLGLGTLCFPFGTILVNHLPSTAALFAALVALRALRAGRARSWRWAFGAGLSACLAVTFEPIAVFPVVALTVYLAHSLWRGSAPGAPGGLAVTPEPQLPAPQLPAPRGWLVAAFLAGAALPAALHLWLTWRTTGGILPVQLRPSLWQFPGSYWNAPRSWDALDEPKWRYGLLCLFGGRGLFSLTPVLLVGLVGLARGLRRGGTFTDGAPPRTESVLMLGGATALGLYIVLRTNNYGGGHYGMRWFLMIVPWLVLALTPVVARWEGWRARLALALLVLPGVYTAQLFWFGKPTVYELLLMRWGWLVLPP